jgi:hypothetical protein
MSRALRTIFTTIFFMAPAGDARADAVSFGPHDVQTVFFISKSDDRNRVDYAIHLTDHCAPTGDDAIFPYWHEFEFNPPHTHTLGMLEYVPYGFSEQRLVHRTQNGGDQFVRLKQLERPILVTAKKEADGSCSAIARARIGGVEGAQLVSVYVHLTGPLSVDYIDIHGKNLATGADLTERVHK